MKEKEGDLITEAEIRDILNLPDDVIVTRGNMKQIVNIIKGSYLLYEKIMNIKESNFSITFNRKIKLYATLENYLSYQKFIQDIGSKMRIEVGYYKKGNKVTNPFWTYTEFDNDNKIRVVKMAYQSFIFNILYKIVSDFKIKYNLELEYRDYSINRNLVHSSIWLDGIKFPELLFKKNKGFHIVNNYNFRRAITNSKDIWIGKMREPVQRIIDSIETKA